MTLRKKIARRTVLGTGAASVAGPAVARNMLSIRGGGGGGATPQTITAVNLSGSTFLGGAGSANTVIGTATVTLSPPSPPASGVSWSLAATGDYLKFSINAGTGVLSVGSTDVAVGSWNITIVATRAGYTGSPFSQAEPITGSSSALTVNQNTTRPLQTNGVSGAPNDYPFANIIASVSGGPGNTNDYLVFWSSSTGEASTRWYLNNSSSPPGSGLTSASNLAVPSVPGATWNPSGSDPPTPPVTAWTLRFVNGATSAVIATQAITIDVLNGRDAAGVAHHARQNPFFPPLSQIGVDATINLLQTHISTGIIGGASICPIVAGTMQIDCQFAPVDGAYFPGLNTVQFQYTVDDIVIGGIVTGPATAFVYTGWAPLNINTTTVSWNGGTGIPDGTHALGVILVDVPGGSSATQSLPYYWRCGQQSFIVHNSGTSLATLYASPVTIPTIPRSIGPSNRLNSSKLDFVTWPGFTAVAGTNGTHCTVVPIPLPQSGVIPPASDPTSPMHSLSANAQRANTNWWTEGLTGADPTEYISRQRFFTTVDGGIYAYNDDAEEGQTLEGNYNQSIRHFNYDGSRDDCLSDQMSSAIAGHDGTYWIVFELFGRIVKITHAGAVTTVAGGTTNRALVGFSRGDSTYSESQIDPFLTQVGTIVSPTFGDLRGINRGCWDLTDAVAGNSLLIANPVDHYIAKVTGLAAGHGPVTMFRIAGQDGGIGAAQVNVADNGGMVDGPATEFVTIGTSTIATAPNGAISGTVFTVGASPTGIFAIGQPLHGSGVTAGTLIISAAGAGTWNVNISQSRPAGTAITGSTPVAQLAGPYDVDMADGIVGPDPKGTLYVADYQNSRIVKIAFDSGSGTWTTVSTLFGNQTGAIRWAAAGPTVGSPVGALLTNSPGNTILSATWAAGVLTVVTNAPVVQAGVDSQYGTISVGWTVSFTGLTNSGSGGNGVVNVNLSLAAPNPNFQVASVTDSTHFTVAMPAGAGVIAATLGGTGVSGPAVVTFYADDVYLPVSTTGTPRAIQHGGAHEAYIPLPQSVRINSTGKLVISSTWFDCVVTVNLADGGLGGVPSIVYTSQYGCRVPNTRLNSSTDNSRGRASLNFGISWFQIDVDRGVAGDVSAIGCVGPKDDIFFLDANGNVMGTYWRASADGSSFLDDIGSNDMYRSQPLPVGRQGIGHYNWLIAINRHQGRILSSGLSDDGVSAWRIINPANGDFFADTFSNLNADGGAMERGYTNLLQGSLAGNDPGFSSVNGIFPWGLRPGIMNLHGEGLRSSLGLPGVADTVDGVISTVGPTTAALATYIKNGLGGTVPAPEFSEGGDDNLDCVYLLQRTSVQGSIPGGTAGGGFTPILAPTGYNVLQRAPYATDATAPVISATSATRTGGGATTIHVTWTTDKPTWGVVCAGFASAHGTIAPYHLFAREAFVAGAGNPSYGTSHSVTIQTFQDVLTYVTVIAKDIAGNNAISAEQTVAA